MKTEIHPFRLVVKALLLFILINIIYALIAPPIYKVSGYNTIFPGRVRFPFGDGSDPYIVAVDNLDAMVASHAISAPKKPNEYRVVIIGDSSVWGEDLTAQESISWQWNQLNDQCNKMELEFYNLGYPHPSVVKDLMILDKAMEYDPDMIVWFVTLNTLVPLQITQFIAANSDRAAKIVETYDIPFNYENELVASNVAFYRKTLVGRRSDLARAIKLQALGFVWSATETDVSLPAEPVRLSPDVKSDDRYKGMTPDTDLENVMLLKVLTTGHAMADSLPVLLVNEPIYIATGRNSEVRYNDSYPRWAYDQYRNVMASEAEKNNWHYLDLWDVVPVEYFSDTRFHVSAEGERLLVEHVNPVLQTIACH